MSISVCRQIKKKIDLKDCFVWINKKMLSRLNVLLQVGKSSAFPSNVYQRSLEVNWGLAHLRGMPFGFLNAVVYRPKAHT